MNALRDRQTTEAALRNREADRRRIIANQCVRRAGSYLDRFSGGAATYDRAYHWLTRQPDEYFTDKERLAGWELLEGALSELLIGQEVGE